MKRYAVYRHSAGKIHAVKVGFCWPAFFFGWVWAFVKRLWLMMFILLLANVTARFFAQDAKLNLIAVLSYLGIMYVSGRLGNIWYSLALEKRWFNLLGYFESNSADDAIKEALAGVSNATQ